MNTSNIAIAKLLREIAAVYTLKKKSIFEIRAYENAADSIEHSTSEVKDLWEEGKLDDIPGLGKSLQGYLDELFKKGKVEHFESVKKDYRQVFFDLLDIPGVGPKTAQEIAELGVKDLDDLKAQIKTGKLVEKGFSAKIAEKIMQGALEETSREKGRMLLPYAAAQADKILEYLKKSKNVIEAHPLGSLRRQVATIGDLDFSSSSKNPEKVVEYFVTMPGVSRIVEKGENSATVMLGSGIHSDILVGKPDSYGALLQHFTGSKAHNIKLREFANKKGYSLSEYGLRKGNKAQVTSNKLIKTETEEEFYKVLGMDTPPPEIREDMGEIEAALRSAQGKPNGLPVLVKLGDIKGDLHIHTNFPFPNPSHGPGADSMEDMIKKAKELGYEYIGISDHPPGHGRLSKSDMIKAIEKRTKFIQKLKKDLPAGRQGTKSIHILNGLEIDILPDGSLSVPDEALETLDFVIAGIHSAHRGGKDVITQRLINTLNNPHVDIISHPTNRLLNERNSSDADWEEVFKVAAKNSKLLEINAHSERLDLRDDLVKQAKQLGVKFVINSDAHALDQMNNMPYGVSVARRGWAEKKDIVNAWNWTDFAKWFKIR